MTEVLDSEEELYGISPRAIAVVMFFVTVFLPVGGLNLVDYNLVNYEASEMPPFLYSISWILRLDQGLPGFWSLFNPLFLASAIWFTLPLSLLNILYVRQIFRYFAGLSSQGSAVMVGLLSLLVPTIVSVYITQAGLSFGLIIPIPIQFVIGLVFLHRFREPELTAPWSGIYIDWCWWKSELRRDNYRTTKAPSLSRQLADHEADWLEGW